MGAAVCAVPWQAASGGHGGRDGPRHGQDRPVQGHCRIRRGRRPGPQCRLDHDCGPGERSDQPVAGEEPTAAYALPQGRLADQQAVIGDAEEQLLIGAGIGNVDAAGQERERHQGILLLVKLHLS